MKHDTGPYADIWMKEETESEILAEMPQYLFYEPVGRGKRKLCKCTACGNHGVFELGGTHNENIVCPMCMEQVRMIAHNKMTNFRSLECWIPVVWFQAKGQFLYAVGAKITRKFRRECWDGPDIHAELDIFPYEVYRFAPGEAEEWKKGWVITPGGWNYGWTKLKRPREPIQRGSSYGLYGNGPEKYYLFQTDEIDKSSMKYCGIALYLDDVVDDGEEVYGAIKYMTAYCERPKLELVVKWSMWDVANELVWDRKTNGSAVNWKGNTPWEFLKISKADWNDYRSSSVACVKLLRENRRTFHMSVHELLMTVRDLGMAESWLADAVKLCRRGVPLKQQVKYIEKQKSMGARSWMNGLTMWLDYLDMAEKCGRDVSVSGAIMPRNLLEAHDEMVALRRVMRQEIEARELKEKQQEYEKRMEKLREKYEYRSGNLIIRVPSSAEEIVREGNVLNICVGGYAARHLGGQTTILFLRRRRKPDTPYICIEMTGKDEIRQIHGYKNEWLGNGKTPRDPREKFKPFLNEWLAWVKAGSKRGKTNNKQEVSA